jgi:glycosyltransferase involved in cell wall biosynthesis
MANENTPAATESNSKRKGRVLLVHLKDDHSGSPKVAAMVCCALNAEGYAVSALVGTSGVNGFISSATPAETFAYRTSGNFIRRVTAYIRAQLTIFHRVWRNCDDPNLRLVWVNTVHPVCAALAARLRSVPVVTHVHEVRLSAPLLFEALVFAASKLSKLLICVSEHTAGQIGGTCPKIVIHNCLPPREEARSAAIHSNRRRHGRTPLRVLMASSLRAGKGINDFKTLAKSLEGDPRFAFQLALSCSREEAGEFASAEQPRNMNILFRPNDLFEIYAATDLVLNLSNPEQCIETFGLTLLEALSCGIPVIAPPVGGCRELFMDGEGGWFIHCSDLDQLRHRLSVLADDAQAWARASSAARHAAQRFPNARFSQSVLGVAEDLDAAKDR